MTTQSVQFKQGDTTEKTIYECPKDYKCTVIKSLTISLFLPSLPVLSAPQKAALTLAEEWDERYREFVKAGKHRKLGIYFKPRNSTQLVRRFGILCFNKSPSEDIDLLAMLIPRPKSFLLEPGEKILGKVEPGTYGLLSGDDTISVWVQAIETIKTPKVTSIWD
jgi:hypothetical protein